MWHVVDTNTGAYEQEPGAERLAHDLPYAFCGGCRTPYLLEEGHTCD